MKLKSLLKPTIVIDPTEGITAHTVAHLRGERVRIGEQTVTVREIKLLEDKYILTSVDKSGIMYKTAINVARKKTQLSPMQREMIKENIKQVSKEFSEHPKRLEQMAENYYKNFTEINNYPKFIVKRLLRNFPPEALRNANIEL